jgi:hypothetical protein
MVQVFDAGVGDHKIYDKVFGRVQTAATFTSAFREHFLLGSSTLASSFYSQVIDLIGVLENAHVRLISASVILIYESSPRTAAIQPLVRLIDFAHSVAGEGIGKDESVIFGLQSLARVLQECM